MNKPQRPLRWCLLLALSIAMNSIAADDACETCHRDPGFFTEYRKLYDYYQRWQGSPHQQAGVSCADCHGGNTASDDQETAHSGVLPNNDTRSTLYDRAQPETCGQCHRANRRQFVQSKHFAALMGDRFAPTCTTCHPAMSRRPELRTIVTDACRTCHAPGNEDDLPLIADQAEQLFNQLNVAGGLLGWTRIHFASHNWPNDSRNRVSEMENRFDDILSEVHAFDLAETESEVTELLSELHSIFDVERRANRERIDENGQSL